VPNRKIKWQIYKKFKETVKKRAKANNEHFDWPNDWYQWPNDWSPSRLWPQVHWRI